MRSVSNKNISYGSDGTEYTAAEVDRRVRKAKATKLFDQLTDLGYNVCETCKRNDCTPVTCAHIKSVDWCKKNRCVELAWALDNMVIEGLPCHQIRDKNNVGYKS